MRYLIEEEKPEQMVRYESLPGETSCEPYVWATLLRCTPQDIDNAIGVCPNYLTPEGLAVWREYQRKLNQFVVERGYNAIATYIEADASTTGKEDGEKKAHRGRCYKASIRWKNCSLEGKTHHTIAVDENGKVFDPAPDPRARHESLEEYESPISTVRSIVEVFKVPK